MIKVHLRKKKLKTGKQSLYIEYYKGIQTLANGKIKHLRDYEYLQLYLIDNPKSASEKKIEETMGLRLIVPAKLSKHISTSRPRKGIGYKNVKVINEYGFKKE